MLEVINTHKLMFLLLILSLSLTIRMIRKLYAIGFNNLFFLKIFYYFKNREQYGVPLLKKK